MYGVLTTAVSIGLGRDVVATSRDPRDGRDDDVGAIDASARKIEGADGSGWGHGHSGGRAAAAFTRVACRELGFSFAPFVTTCEGMRQLLAALPSNNTALLDTLCPENADLDAECEDWLEVREPALADEHHLSWVRANALANHRGVLARGADEDGLPDWAALNASSWVVGPVPESPSCGACEHSVVQCFQAILPIEELRGWKRRCSSRLLVGCGSVVHPQHSAASGTWVAGDSDGDAVGGPSALELPKIFVMADGPSDCASGEPAADAAVGAATKPGGAVLGRGNRSGGAAVAAQCVSETVVVSLTHIENRPARQW